MAGLTHDAAALRLTERPFIDEEPAGLWLFYLKVVRSAIRHAEDHTDDRWSPQDWQRAAMRALTAMGHEWSYGAAARARGADRLPSPGPATGPRR
ncbi:hypothetical protein GCM10010353_65160 [Streptomyces chryseus]|nr:hypothetical protein GCM10010353_65160 [Streptomyces chryseus]